VRKAVPDRQRQQVSRTASIPAPIGGWDAQSAIADMPIQNAVILDNMIPRPGYVELRRGSFLQASGIAQGTVKTLLVWRGSSDKLLACAGTSIYDVTTQGTSNPAALYSAATVATWESINFANDAGTWIVAVNGTDTPIKYDGTTVTTTAFTGTSGSITLDPKTLNIITAHKRRLHMGEKNTLRVWFPTSTDALAGACGLLDLGPVFTKGGYLVAMGTLSLDYGTGLDDFVAYFTNQGQIALYQGTDPGDPTAWALVGVYNVGFPMGPRSLVKYGSDLAVITTDGVIMLSQAIRLDRAQDNAVALTQRIQDAFHTATESYPAGTFGWQGMLYPKGSLAIFNIPSTPAQQFVQNVQTGAWCRFTGIDATCIATANNAIYFGSGSSVLQFDIGADDNGTAITYDLKTAFTGLRTSQQKRFTAIRPLMSTVAWLRPALEVDVDYRDTVPTATAIVVDVSDLTAVPQYAWSACSGIGFVASARMRIMAQNVPQTFLAVDSADVDEIVTGDGYSIITADAVPNVPFQLTSFDLLYEPGGVL
jgi:hypothetical protein